MCVQHQSKNDGINNGKEATILSVYRKHAQTNFPFPEILGFCTSENRFKVKVTVRPKLNLLQVDLPSTVTYSFPIFDLFSPSVQYMQSGEVQCSKAHAFPVY